MPALVIACHASLSQQQSCERQSATDWLRRVQTMLTTLRRSCPTRTPSARPATKLCMYMHMRHAEVHVQNCKTTQRQPRAPTLSRAHKPRHKQARGLNTASALRHVRSLPAAAARTHSVPAVLTPTSLSLAHARDASSAQHMMKAMKVALTAQLPFIHKAQHHARCCGQQHARLRQPAHTGVSQQSAAGRSMARAANAGRGGPQAVRV